ncbi:family 20 glycosylhydrolase [Microbacterium sp. GXF6406]
MVFGAFSAVAPAVAAPDEGENLALASAGATVEASGQEVPGQWGPELAIDGVRDPGTSGPRQSRWSSNGADDANLTVRLAEPTVIDHIAIEWETACAAEYLIQVSADGETFVDATEVLSPVCGLRDVQTLTLVDPAVEYQFVRMQGVERTPINGNKYGISLWELEVWDGPEPEVVPSPVNGLVPLPRSVEADAEAEPFVLRDGARIATDAALAPSAEFLADLAGASTGFDLSVEVGASEGDIVLRTGEVTGLTGEEESYALTVDDERITIVAPTDHGAFNAVQTLRQLFPAHIESDRVVEATWAVPAVEITDAPRFAYRGMMLDVARSFLTADEVKTVLDTMAAHKLSVMHFHIADDQGWRLEITNEGKADGDPIDYSLLTEISGATAMTSHGYNDELGRTGYYTQEQFSDILAYAADLHIEVVPEIDTPGHTNAALHAIEELNSAGSHPGAEPETGRVAANGTKDVGYSSLDANNEYTWMFMEHVLGQLAALTPGDYLHIGGDESHVTSHENYVSFITRSVDIVHGLGKKMIGWNESSIAGVTEDDAIQYWIGNTTDTLDAIKNKGVKLIASRGGNAYLDMKYTDKTPIGLTWAAVGDFPLYYDWDPAEVITDNGVKLDDDQLLGVEGPMWAETIRGREQAEFLSFPRAFAHAEIGWTPQEQRNGADFAQRMADVGERLLIGGANFYDGVHATWDWSAAGVPVELSPGSDAEMTVGSVAAPGTKASADGASIAVDRVDDEDGISSSALGSALTATIDWGDGSPVSSAAFRTETERTSLSAGGLYDVRGSHSYAEAGQYTGTIEFSDGTRTEFTVTIAEGTADPVEPPVWDESQTPTLTADSTVAAGARLPGEITGFVPGSYVALSLGDTALGTVRPDEDGVLALSLPISPDTEGGVYTLTATAGDREARTEVEVTANRRQLKNPIDQSALSIADVGSEETRSEDTPATNAIDGDPETFWHTAWNGEGSTYPHWITIDLGDRYDVSGFSFQQRQNGTNGRIADYEVSVSDTKADRGTLASDGRLYDITREQVIEFDETVAGRYVTLVALSSSNGAEFAGAAEINIGGTLVGETDPEPEPGTPSVTLGASEVVAGEALDIRAAGLQPETPVRITLESPENGEPEALRLLAEARIAAELGEGVQTDAEGRLAVSVTVPAGVAAGGYALVVAQPESGLRASAAVTVLAAADPAEPGAPTEPGDSTEPGGTGDAASPDGTGAADGTAGGGLAATGSGPITGVIALAALLAVGGALLVGFRRRTT